MTSTHWQKHRDAAMNEGDMWNKIDQELHQGFLEVEITGLTLRRLVVAYGVMFRGAWGYTLDSVRSLLRPTPAL